VNENDAAVEIEFLVTESLGKGRFQVFKGDSLLILKGPIPASLGIRVAHDLHADRIVMEWNHRRA
jgi:hypothetical protein